MAGQFLQWMLLSAALCLVVQKASSYQSMLNKMNWAHQNKMEGPYHLNQSVLAQGRPMKVISLSRVLRRMSIAIPIRTPSCLKLPIRFQRAPGDPISVIHLRLNDNNPYAIISYAGSVS